MRRFISEIISFFTTIVLSSVAHLRGGGPIICLSRYKKKKKHNDCEIRIKNQKLKIKLCDKYAYFIRYEAGRGCAQQVVVKMGIEIRSICILFNIF
jgi:hypothetical protein